jgi:peptidoglycan hydrolase-like protein with peptidoglycan-binding domain
MGEDGARARPARVFKAAAVVVAALVVGGSVVGWALTTVLQPAKDPSQAASYTFATVSQGEVGSSIALNAVAQWTPAKAAVNGAGGIVTGVSVSPGDEVSQGRVLYTVNLRPVVIAQGTVPAFRSIESGTRGQDVAQLQSMLTALGLYRGPADGVAGTATVAAIGAWQKSLGEDATGSVAYGDVVFVSTLPTRISLNADIIARGNSVSGGEPAIQTLPASPKFTLPVTQAQAGLVATGTRIEVTAPEGSKWEAYATGQTQDAQAQTIEISLVGKDGATVCGDQCGQVPVTGQAELRASIVTVEPVQGLVIPSAALVTGADGKTAVITGQGRRTPVKVTASAKGMSVIEGILSGVRVRVPGNNAGAGQ